MLASSKFVFCFDLQYVQVYWSETLAFRSSLEDNKLSHNVYFPVNVEAAGIIKEIVVIMVMETSGGNHAWHGMTGAA